MANEKMEAFVLHSGGASTEYPVLDRETYEALLKAILRITPLENTSLTHEEMIVALQSAVAKLQETDTEATESLKELDTRITKAQTTADSNTAKYQAINEVVTNEQTKLKDEIERAKDIEGDLSDLNTVVKDNLVAAINYLLTRAEKNSESIGTLSNLETEEKTDIVKAINEIEDLKADKTEIDIITSKVDDYVSKFSDLENSTNNFIKKVTTAVSDVNSAVAKVTTAVNKVDAMQDTIDSKADSAEIGNLADLTTEAKDTLVAAINEAAASSGSDVNVIYPLTVETAPTAVSYTYTETGENSLSDEAAETKTYTGIAIGDNAAATGAAIAIGNYAFAQGTKAEVTRLDELTRSDTAIAIGDESYAHFSSVAVGPIASAYETAVAIGFQAVGIKDSVAIGYRAHTQSDGATAIGANSVASGENSVAIGNGSLTFDDDVVTVGCGSNTEGYVATRRIINVTDPTDAQDAATKAYVDSSIQTKSSNVNTVAPLSGTKGATAADETCVAIGEGSSTVANAVAIGYNAKASIGTGIAIGNNTSTGASDAIAIGTGISGSRSSSIVIGDKATVGESSEVVIGVGAAATGLNSTAIGAGASAKAANSVAVGGGSSTTEQKTFAVGSSSSTRRIVNVTDPTNAQDAATKNYVDTNINTVSEDVTTLVGSDSGKSVATIANEVLTKALVPADAKESLDTLEEIAAWIQAHPDDASAMNEAIEALKTRMTSAETNIDAKANQTDLSSLSKNVTTLATVAAQKLDKSSVDTALSATSTNPVTNKAIYTALASKADSKTVTELEISLETAESNISSLQTTVSTKADSSTVSNLQNTVNNKADSSTVSSLQSTVSSLQSTVNNKADQSSVDSVSSNLSGLIATCQGDLSDLEDKVNAQPTIRRLETTSGQVSGGVALLSWYDSAINDNSLIELYTSDSTATIETIGQTENYVTASVNTSIGDGSWLYGTIVVIN